LAKDAEPVSWPYVWPANVQLGVVVHGS